MNKISSVICFDRFTNCTQNAGESFLDNWQPLRP